MKWKSFAIKLKNNIVWILLNVRLLSIRDDLFALPFSQLSYAYNTEKSNRAGIVQFCWYSLLINLSNSIIYSIRFHSVVAVVSCLISIEINQFSISNYKCFASCWERRLRRRWWWELSCRFRFCVLLLDFLEIISNLKWNLLLVRRVDFLATILL